MRQLDHAAEQVNVCTGRELILSLTALERLHAEWAGLYHRCPNASPFQAPAWLLPWARHFAPDRIKAIAIRERGALMALVPFFVWDGRVLLAGTGPTDYCDGLFADDGATAAEEALAAMGSTACELGSERIDLQQLPVHSPLLGAPAPRGWESRVEEGTVCPVAKLSLDDGLGGVSIRWRKNLAQARRRLESLPGFQLRLTSTRLFEGAAQVLERLHAQRWEQRGEAGVLSDGLMRGFLRSLLPELSAAALLRLHTLEIGSHTVAAVLVVHERGAAYFYLSGFDPEWSRFSPGNVTVAAAMNQAASEGAREFHFLRGRESYKYHFGAQDRPTRCRILSRARDY